MVPLPVPNLTLICAACTCHAVIVADFLPESCRDFGDVCKQVSRWAYWVFKGGR